MANYTGSELLLQILGDTGAVLSPLQQHSLSARLQQMLDAGTSSDLQVAALIGSNPQIRASVPAGETPSTYLAGITEAAKAEISDSDDSVISVTASAESVDEGDSVDFIIQAADGEDALVEGTEIPYTITGISADDTDAALTGIAIIGADGTATITVMLKEDGVTEGEEIMTLRALGASAAVTVNDTSTAPVEVVSIEAATNRVVEGTSLEFTVTMDHAVDEDTTLTYQIQGIATSVAAPADPVADLGLLNGTVTILAGESTGTFTLTPADDGITEGFEAFKVVLLDENLEAGKSTGPILIEDAPNSGQSFTLTTGVDEFVGGAGNDTFSATNTTLTALDSLDGGAGTDVLNFNATAAVSALPGVTVANIETMNIRAANTFAGDVSSYTGLTTLNVNQAENTLAVTAAATTDVNTSSTKNTIDIEGGNNITVTDATADFDINIGESGAGTKNAAGTITVTDSKLGDGSIAVDGGTDVTVTASGVAEDGSNDDTITIGATTAATGDVVVNSTGVAYVAGTASSLHDIAVTGGKSISVTQVATSDASKAATDTGAANITQGDITATANASTTTVTVKQDAAVTANNAAFTTGGVTESASVKFGVLKSGDTLTIDTNSNVTIDAGELTITAKADMTAEEVAAAFASLVNDAAKGTLPAGDTQTDAAYTKATYTGVEDDWTSAAASGDTVVFTSNTARTDVANLDFYLVNTSTNSVAPVVTTTPGKAHDATNAGGVAGVVAGTVTVAAGAALTTVSIDSYGAGSAITGAAAALNSISLANGAAFTVSDTADTVTLTLEDVTGAVTFTAQPETLNVNSIGNNTSGIVSSAVTETLNVSGTGTLNATGAKLAAVKSVTVTETAGLNLTGATLTALASVDATATTGTTTVAIDGTQTTYAGGAGVDNVTVSNAGTAISKAISLGGGDDKLTLDGAAVVVPTVTLAAGDGTDTLSISGASAAALDGDTTFASKLTGFERLEITGATGGVTLNVENLGFADYVTLAGTAGATAISNLANNADLVINANVTTSVTASIKDDATGTADVLNVELTKDGILGASDLIATEIETVNLTVTDSVTTNGISTHTMNFDSAKATSLNIDGNAGLTLALDANTVKLATIDASDMTSGGLSVTANGQNVMTITGGAGADVLTASATKADILNGGDGNDVLIAGFNGASLTGGAGNDLFVVAADSATGNQEANTYSKILDFQAGDKIQLGYYETEGAATVLVDSFAELNASLDESTASFSNFVDAAFQEMTTAGDAVWFSFGDDSYIVMDSNASAGNYAAQNSFTDGEDLIVRVQGVADLSEVSFNSDYGTIEMA